MKGGSFLLILLLAFNISGIGQVIMSTNKKAIKLYGQAKKLIDDRDFRGGITKYRSAIQKDSSFAEAYRQAAAAYTTLNKPDSALIYYQQLARRFPQEKYYSTAHLKLAQASFRSGNYGKALNHAKQYLSLNKGNNRYTQHAKVIEESCLFALERLDNH